MPQVTPRFFNRELSWIEFNSRVLYEAQRTDMPLLERLKFLSIVTSNFDEFFMVRVAAVKRQISHGDTVQCPSGIRPTELLDRILTRVREIERTKDDLLLNEVLPDMATQGLRLRRPDQFTSAQTSFVKNLFLSEVFPVLTPVRAPVGGELPYATNLRLHAAFILEPQEGSQWLGHGDDASQEYLALVQIPPSLERIVYLPDESGVVSFALLEDVVLAHAGSLFPGYTLLEHCVFTVTRDADMGVDEERDEDFVEAMEQVLQGRQFSDVVRLSITHGVGRIRDLLAQAVGIDSAEVFEHVGPLNLGDFMPLTSVHGFDGLRNDRWPNWDSPLVNEDESLWELIRRRDLMLYHPFESFDPVVQLLQLAASDPGVLAIKMTLYRTSGESPVVRALEHAATQGKQVTVLVEIKARFDEERNISWADRLERAGVIVVYGVAGLKVHAKALLIIRRQKSGVQRYVHLGTGNYNDKTALLYTDLGLFTARSDIAYEVGLFFNAITGYSAVPALTKLHMAPVAMKTKIIQLIEREAHRVRSGVTGHIMAKLNSLADPDVIQALYTASQAGVTIDLNIRGICMLVPGVPGLSETISVVSVIDRYLEHARLYHFQNGGSPEVFAGSADWMPRNLERRVELMFPIEDPTAIARVETILGLAFKDNRNAHKLQSDGSYRPVDPKGEKLMQSQAELQRLARKGVRESGRSDGTEFTVRRRPPGK